MFTINSNILETLSSINHFTINEDELIFFGLRGTLPVDEDNHEYQKDHLVQLTEIDYSHPRCTLIQWKPSEKMIAIFPGSTVPHLRNIKRSLERGGRGTNMLLTGYYEDYRKGWHKAGSDTGHQALRQNNKLPVRRTADDLDYDNDDRVEYTRPYDNLHAGWSMGPNHDYFSSAGCQVVV